MGANVGKLEQSKTQKLFGSNERNDTLFDTISQACFFFKGGHRQREKNKIFP